MDGDVIGSMASKFRLMGEHLHLKYIIRANIKVYSNSESIIRLTSGGQRTREKPGSASGGKITLTIGRRDDIDHEKEV